MQIDKIYNEDCIKTISNMADDFIDLIITSPPYNVNLGKNKFNKNPYDLYNDNKEHDEYILWLKSIFEKLYPKMKKGSRICINMGDGKNGAVPTSSDIIQFMKEIGYIFFTQIIWNKKSAAGRTSWGSFCSPRSPSFPTPYEHILIFCKETRRLESEGETDLTKKEFIDWSLALWEIKPENKQKKYGHPAMFPVELVERCLKMLSWKNCIVYDPFMGSGTTAVACKKFSRHYIGSEISLEYCKIAEERINQESDIFN